MLVTLKIQRVKRFRYLFIFLIFIRNFGVS